MKFHERFAQAIRHTQNESGSDRVSLSEIARRSQECGFPVTISHLSQLRSGRKNPGWATVRGISCALGISPAFFDDDLEYIDQHTVEFYRQLTELKPNSSLKNIHLYDQVLTRLASASDDQIVLADILRLIEDKGSQDKHTDDTR